MAIQNKLEKIARKLISIIKKAQGRNDRQSSITPEPELDKMWTVLAKVNDPRIMWLFEMLPPETRVSIFRDANGDPHIMAIETINEAKKLGIDVRKTFAEFYKMNPDTAGSSQPKQTKSQQPNRQVNPNALPPLTREQQNQWLSMPLPQRMEMLRRVGPQGIPGELDRLAGRQRQVQPPAAAGAQPHQAPAPSPQIPDIFRKKNVDVQPQPQGGVGPQLIR